MIDTEPFLVPEVASKYSSKKCTLRRYFPCGTDWFRKRFESVRTVGIANQKQTFLERLYVARSERFSKRFSDVYYCNRAIGKSTPHSK